MIVQKIRTELLSIPALAAWPEVVSLIERPVDEASLPCWEHSVLACRAVGGSDDQALPGSVAIFCLLCSIYLVDDLLDRDPEGLQHIYGEGRVANFGLAFQAAASVAVERAGLAPRLRARIHEELARAALSTAYGQHLDLEDLEGEEDYWQVVEAKTPPLFSAALAIGAMLGGAPKASVEELRRLGFLLGKIVQIGDDLKDSFETPAAPDWSRQQNNLPILYAATADHAERSAFLDLLPRVGDEESLAAAQDILVRSGAVSFCAYNMLTLRRDADALLLASDLADPKPLKDMIGHYLEPLANLLERVGVESPEELIGEE